MVIAGQELSNKESLIREALMILIDGALACHDEELFTRLTELVKP